MWALGLIVGVLIGAVLAQGAGALVGAIVGVAALWEVLILGVVVLAWMAWQLSRQLNASPSSLKSEADAIDRPA
jgi:threonine/homoserine/homoserine lactone efflux protein